MKTSATKKDISARPINEIESELNELQSELDFRILLKSLDECKNFHLAIFTQNYGSRSIPFKSFNELCQFCESIKEIKKGRLD